MIALVDFVMGIVDGAQHMRHFIQFRMARCSVISQRADDCFT